MFVVDSCFLPLHTATLVRCRYNSPRCNFSLSSKKAVGAATSIQRRLQQRNRMSSRPRWHISHNIPKPASVLSGNDTQVQFPSLVFNNRESQPNQHSGTNADTSLHRSWTCDTIHQPVVARDPLWTFASTSPIRSVNLARASVIRTLLNTKATESIACNHHTAWHRPLSNFSMLCNLSHAAASPLISLLTNRWCQLSSQSCCIRWELRFADCLIVHLASEVPLAQRVDTKHKRLSELMSIARVSTSLSRQSDIAQLVVRFRTVKACPQTVALASTTPKLCDRAVDGSTRLGHRHCRRAIN